MALKLSVAHYKQKKYFLLQDHQFAEGLILVFGLQERTKRALKRICNYICRNYGYNYFHVKYLKLLVKPLLHSVFSLIT